MTTIDEQLIKYLADAHSIEEQALVQMKLAPKMAGNPQIAGDFKNHLAETERHERRVRTALEARNAAPSAIKDVVMQAGGVGFALFARVQPDTPGKLAAHAYSYEHLELASYELLHRVAQRAGAAEVAAMAAEIREEERAMGERLAADFDLAAEASLRDKGAEKKAEKKKAKMNGASNKKGNNPKAFSMARVTFSPTTLPILPPMKSKSSKAATSACPSTVPSPAMQASVCPVFFWLCVKRTE